MPAAPDLYVLHDPEAQLEDGIVACLEAHGLANVVTRRSREDVGLTHVAVLVVAGGAQGHQSASTDTGTGANEQDWFNAAVEVVVQTERETEARSTITGITGRHAERVARARVALLRGSIREHATSLQYLSIYETSFAGVSHSIDDDNGTDTTRLVWSLGYRILPDAWPA
jgi:hypothetical protein